MRQSLTIFFIFCLLLEGLAQVRLDFSENSLPLYKTITFRSAALLPDKSTIDMGAIIYGKSYVGVNQQYLIGNYAFGEKANKAIGLLVHIKNRGNLISENAAKLAYNQTVSLNQKYKLSLAATAGLYNIALESTNTTPGASDFAFDSDWSMALKSDTWKASFYYGNITSPEIQLIDEGILYQKYLGTYFDKVITWPSKLKGRGMLNIYRQARQISWRTSYEQELISNFYFSINGNTESLGTSISIEELTLAGGILHIYFGYAFPFFSGHEVVTSPFQLQLSLRVPN